MQKTQTLCCWEGVYSAVSYSIAVCVYVAAGMCLPSRCLAVNVYSDFATPPLGRHVTESWKMARSPLSKYLCNHHSRAPYHIFHHHAIHGVESTSLNNLRTNRIKTKTNVFNFVQLLKICINSNIISYFRSYPHLLCNECPMTLWRRYWFTYY
jgi:hypothetical protein